VVPTPIEDAIGMSRFINQVVLFGANRPTNIALLVPEWAAIRTELKLDANKTEEELASDHRVKALIDKEIAATCARMKKFEIPHAWAFVAPFTVANGMLTQKLSVRRHKVISTYTKIIAGLYGDEVVEAAESDKDVVKEQAAAA
jgi:long-chain acyl-CoA synthetase